MVKYMFILFFSLCSLNVAFSQSINRLNKNGERTGKWINYTDESNKLKLFEGKFRNGKPIGKAYFYNNAGVLDRTEINRFKKLKTTFYHPNGVVRLKGKARLVNEPDRIHYYFYGKWVAYNDSGIAVKHYFYEDGKLLKTVYLDKNIRTNDSLIEALNLIDKEFARHNKSLTDSMNSNIKNRDKQKVFKAELKYQDSLSFDQIGKILNIYGYPSSAIAGESSVIPFYMISFAPVTVREKYLQVFQNAAIHGDLSWNTVALFIDKLKIEKKEKQIYGTQSYYDKNDKEVFYPSEDEAHLNERRLSIGLEKREQ